MTTAPESFDTYADVAFAADSYRCYIGETITLFARVRAEREIAGYTLTVVVPAGLNAESFRVSPSGGQDVPRVFLIDGTNYLEWRVANTLTAGTQVEYEIRATVAHASGDTTLDTHLIVSIHGGGPTPLRAQVSLSIPVTTRADYLKYLPALYSGDELMGRFLMLFESFWTPIERQIDSIHAYFDPRLTPANLLPWLASWMDMLLDERWPEPAQRLLLSRVSSLYRKRGTRGGLSEYLEIYTGQTPVIVERRADNFKLGTTRLGQAVALGRDNAPHSFGVTLTLPPVEAGSEAESARKERDRRRMIESIIEAEKPAHTSYDLTIEMMPASQPLPLHP